MSTSIIKTPTLFWVISILALIWNVMGVMAYLGQVYITDEVLASLPEAAQVGERRSRGRTPLEDLRGNRPLEPNIQRGANFGHHDGSACFCLTRKIVG